MSAFNLLEIKNDIGATHKEFIDENRGGIEKTSADYHLNLVRVTTRLRAILGCFMIEGIIDSSLPITMAEFDQSYNGVQLCKSGYDKSVTIWHNGTEIIMNDSSFLVKTGFLEPMRLIYDDVTIEDTDWKGFSNDLLSMIHRVIYQRSKAISLELFKFKT